MQYFYRIKVPKLNSQYHFANEWNYSAFDIGYIEAESKKEAREKLEDKLGIQLTMRSLKKDIGHKNIYLLQLYEPNSFFDKLWLSQRKCEICGQEYTKLERDKANDCIRINEKFCSVTCEDQAKAIQKESINYSTHPAVIYKITNKNNGKSYIGKTTQSFTLRWYQHFFQSSNTKFHQEIKQTKYSDWIFEILETFGFNGSDIDFNDSKGYNKLLTEREKYYIDKYDSINNGYNTADIKLKEE